MRISPPISFAAISIAASVVASTDQPAEACGYVTPAVFLVSTHEIRADRSFHSLVRLSDPAPEHLAWDLANPMGYDGTQIAPAPSADGDHTFTLVSPSGTRLVTSRRQKFIQHDMWNYDAAPSLAVDLGDIGNRAVSGYRVALRGTHKDAKLRTITTSDGKGRIDLAQLGVVETAEAYADNGPVVHITRDGRDMGTYPGRVVGELETAQQNFIVVADHGNARAIAIW